MTNDEIRARLDELGEDLYDSDDNKPELTKKLIKAEKAAENDAETPPDAPVDDTAGSKPQEEEEETPEKAKGEYRVFAENGDYVRTYTNDRHGKEAQKLAEQFCKKISGKIK